MASVLIVYGSTTGNTGYMADVIGQTLSAAGHAVTVKDVADVDAAGLCAGYDLCLFGCSTWGDDEVELQDDFTEFLPDLESTGVKGKKTAVFGPGDSTYAHFCGAVDVIAEKLTELGAPPVADGLKIDGDPRAEKDEIENWAKDLLKAL